MLLLDNAGGMPAGRCVAGAGKLLCAPDVLLTGGLRSSISTKVAAMVTPPTASLVVESLRSH